jgi:DNA-directed RNA polymerase specialized sigma24 family protein
VTSPNRRRPACFDHATLPVNAMSADADARSLEWCYRRYYDRVLAYALRRTDRERALEATAETFVIAWRRFGDLPAEPLPWLLGVARNVLARQRRADGRQGALLDRLAATPSGQVGHDPAERVVAAAAMRVALARLGEADRELLMLLA